MRWSIEELLKAIRAESPDGFWDKIIRFPITLYKSIKVFFFWVFNGYCRISLMDADETIVYDILLRMKQFRKEKREGHPYPQFSNMEEWNDFIDNLIKRFEDILYNEPACDVRDLTPGEKINHKSEFISSMDSLLGGPVVINMEKHDDWVKRRKETLDLFIKNIDTFWH